MKKKYWIIIVIIALLIIAAILYYMRTHPDGPGGQGGPSSIPTTITFGNHSSGACLGRGVCNAIAAGQVGAPNTSIGVNFNQDANNTNVIYMSFSMHALQGASGQAAQVADFSAPNNTYAFDMPYSISKDNPLFLKWGIPFNAVISPLSPGHFGLSGVSIIDTITMATSMPVVEWVVFGDTAGGPCNSGARGICRCSSVQIAGAVQVTFSLQSGNASHMIMSFNINDLAASGQNAQVPLFNAPNTSYIFTSPFQFSDPSFAALQISPTSIVTSACGSSMSVSATGMVSDTISYTTTNVLTPR